MHKVGEVSGLEQCRQIEVVCFLVLIVFLYKTTFRHILCPSVISPSTVRYYLVLFRKALLKSPLSKQIGFA